MLTRILMLSALFATVSYSTSGQEAGDPAKGFIHAQQVCAQCHAIRGGNKLSPNPLAPSFETIANTSGVTGMSLAASLHSTHENMPNFVLSKTDRNNVIAYILSLKRERQGMIRETN